MQAQKSLLEFGKVIKQFTVLMVFMLAANLLFAADFDVKSYKQLLSNKQYEKAIGLFDVKKLDAAPYHLQLYYDLANQNAYPERLDNLFCEKVFINTPNHYELTYIAYGCEQLMSFLNTGFLDDKAMMGLRKNIHMLFRDEKFLLAAFDDLQNKSKKRLLALSAEHCSGIYFRILDRADLSEISESKEKQDLIASYQSMEDDFISCNAIDYLLGSESPIKDFCNTDLHSEIAQRRLRYMVSGAIRYKDKVKSRSDIINASDRAKYLLRKACVLQND